MFEDFNSGNDPRKRILAGIVNETESAIQAAMAMSSVLGIDPRELTKALVARVISHFYLSVQKADGETVAQTWLEQAMGAVCEHFAHHEVTDLKVVIVRQEAAIPLPEPPKPPEPTTANGLTEEEVTLIKRGEWIYAIKSVRERTGMGLKEAKEFVDRFRAPHRVCSHCHGRGMIPA